MNRIAECIHISEARGAGGLPRAGDARRLILVVEDEPDVRSLVAAHLIAEGFDVCIASDGETALQLVRERRPGLVCLDLNLPRISGYDVCEQIRTDPAAKDIAILMTSARNSLDIKVFSLEAGADSFLAKPYALQSLTEEIEELFELREELLGLRESPATPSEALHACTG
jgi:DNA-binding response OmpR family regulator